MLVSIADGSCDEGSSDNPANDRDRGREHQRARTRFTLAGFRRIAGMQRSLPRRGATTHHACPAWSPFRAAGLSLTRLWRLAIWRVVLGLYLIDLEM